jgi:hypothetical protein
MFAALFETRAHWPQNVHMTPLDLFDQLGVDASTNELFWNGEQLVTEKRFSAFERALAVLGLAVAVIAGSAVAVPAAEEKLVPATEAGFASLLKGCWYTDMWQADFLDGTEAFGSSTICFRNGAALSISYDAYSGTKTGTVHSNVKGSGTYKFEDSRLLVGYEGDAKTWPFPQELMDCDAAIRPGDELRLSNCNTNDPDQADWTYSFSWVTSD